MRCHAPAIKQAGWSKGIDPGTDRRDPPNPFRPTRNPVRDEVARLPNTRASATGNNQRVERWRFAQCSVRLKRNSGFSAKRFIRYPNDDDFVARPSLSVVTLDFRYRECVRGPMISSAWTPSYPINPTRSGFISAQINLGRRCHK